MDLQLRPITNAMLVRAKSRLPLRKNIESDKCSKMLEDKDGNMITVMFEWSNLGWVLLNPIIVPADDGGKVMIMCRDCDSQEHLFNKDFEKVKCTKCGCITKVILS
jgi:hypothetical protein